MSVVAVNAVYEALARGRKIVASDGHFKVDQFVSYRVDRRLRTEATLKVTMGMTHEFLKSELTSEQMAQFEKRGYVDAGLDFRSRDGLAALGRIRLNARSASQRGALNLAVRFLSPRIFSIEEFGLGDYVENSLLNLHRGLDLISAPMGMAKTSLRAAILQTFNERHGVTITSYEDPIELLLEARKGSIEQIEVGADIASYADGARALRRTDTDICSYGELRDRETKRAAVAAAKSMHVVATSHANTAGEAIDDIIDAFTPEEQPEIRSGLAQSLNSVLVLRALPRMKRLDPEQLNGRQNIRIAAEILHVTPGVRNLIRKGETHRIPGVQMGSDREFGSRTLDAHIAQLCYAGEVDPNDPLVMREIRNRSNFEADLKALASRGGRL